MKLRAGKISLGFVVWSLDALGGSEKVVYDIARKLNRMDYVITVISLKDGHMRERYGGLGVKIRVVDRSSKTAMIRTLRKAIIEEGIEILNPHHFPPLFYSSIASAGLGTSIVYTEHSRWQMEQLPLAWKMINRVILNRIDAVVALSAQIEDYYARRLRLRPGRIHVILNGIDLESYRSIDAAAARNSLGIKEGEKVIGTVAHFRPEKNHRLLISAFSELLKNGVDARLVLVGRDFMNGEIQNFASALNVTDRLLFLGERMDVPRILQTFDVFCLPSCYEGMPLTVLEAMAAGIPVVGSNVLGINEVVTNGRNGLLFPDNSAGHLANCIKTLLDSPDLRRRLTQAAKNDVKIRFSIDEKAFQYDRLFHAMVAT